MSKRMPYNSFKPPGIFTGAIIILAVIAMGLMGYERFKELKTIDPVKKVTRQFKAELFGFLPSPTQPELSEPVKKAIIPKIIPKAKQAPKMRKIVVKRIPTLRPGMKMPHKYWGPCNKCHLRQGGPPPGSQPITPVGKMWEKASTIKKVGPPILPDSTRHHPPAGRCIKCHDIVIQMAI